MANFHPLRCGRSLAALLGVTGVLRVPSCPLFAAGRLEMSPFACWCSCPVSMCCQAREQPLRTHLPLAVVLEHKMLQVFQKVAPALGLKHMKKAKNTTQCFCCSSVTPSQSSHPPQPGSMEALKARLGPFPAPLTSCPCPSWADGECPPRVPHPGCCPSGHLNCWKPCGHCPCPGTAGLPSPSIAFGGFVLAAVLLSGRGRR